MPLVPDGRGRGEDEGARDHDRHEGEAEESERVLREGGAVPRGDGIGVGGRDVPLLGEDSHVYRSAEINVCTKEVRESRFASARGELGRGRGRGKLNRSSPCEMPSKVLYKVQVPLSQPEGAGEAGQDITSKKTPSFEWKKD